MGVRQAGWDQSLSEQPLPQAQAALVAVAVMGDGAEKQGHKKWAFQGGARFLAVRGEAGHWQVWGQEGEVPGLS